LVLSVLLRIGFSLSAGEEPKLRKVQKNSARLALSFDLVVNEYPTAKSYWLT